MKTRESIEAQATEQKQGEPSEPTPSESPVRGQHPNSLANLVAPWKPGQSGNPSGRPKNDLSQIIARAIFENNPELVYHSFAKLLQKGSAFGFQVLSERAYGKLKETRDTGSEFNEVPDDQLQVEIDRIMSRLDLARAVNAATEAGVAKARASKANGKAKDPVVLPGNGTAKA